MNTRRVSQWRRLAAGLLVTGWLAVGAIVPAAIIAATPVQAAQQTLGPGVVACWGVVHRSLDGSNPSYVTVWAHIDGAGNPTIVFTLQGPGGNKSQSRELPPDGFVNVDFPIPSYGQYEISVYSFTTLIYGEAFRVGANSKTCTRDTVAVLVIPPTTTTRATSTTLTTTTAVSGATTTTKDENSSVWFVLIFVGGVLVAVGTVVMRRGGASVGHEESILYQIDGDTLVHPWTADGGLGHPGWDDGPLLPGGSAFSPEHSRYDDYTDTNTTNTTNTETVEDSYKPKPFIRTPELHFGTDLGIATDPGIYTETSVSEEKAERDCSELRARCEKLRAEAEQAEEAARSERERASRARRACDEAKDARARAVAALAEAENPPDERSWAESEGRRITSHDLRLRRAAAQRSWAKYQSGEISAQQLESEWEQQGESEALEELREQDRAAREFRAAKARRELEEARAREEKLCPEASTAEQEADSAATRSEEARAAADAACRAADECEGVSTSPEDGGGGSEGDGGGAMTPETPDGDTIPPAPGPTPPTEPGAGGTTPPQGPAQGPAIPASPTPASSAPERQANRPPCRCGPDVTDIYIAALNTIVDRLRANVNWLEAWTPGVGIAFLFSNGWSMDFWADPTPGCPSCPHCARTVELRAAGQEDASCNRCRNTVTLAGVCVTNHTLNDLIFGICAGYFGTPETIQDLGGHFAELTSYGSLDPQISRDIYRVGNSIGRRAYDNAEFRVDVDVLGEVVAVAPKHDDCPPCTEKAVSTSRNFATATWD